MHPKAIITFNISGLPSPRHARARMAAFARLAQQTDADLINLQEVHTYGLLQILRNHLKSFPHVSCQPGLIGPRAGLVTFSKHPIQATEFFSLSFHRGVLVTRLADVTVLNAHLIANTDGDWSPTNRFYPKHRASLDRLQAIAQTHERHTARLILTGDLNLAKTCDLYERFAQAGEWQDAFGSRNDPTFHHEYLPADRQPQCVDYIFTKGQKPPTDARQLFHGQVTLPGGQRVYLSNHLGLYAKL